MVAVQSPLPLTASSPRGTAVVAILNATPDSFFDGAETSVEERRARGVAAFEAGAAWVDIGGESTRPGAPRVPAETQIARVIPLVAAIAAAGPVSVDTTRASVAAAALAAGATMINDVSCLGDDPELASVVAAHDAFLVLSHARGGQSQLRGFGAVAEGSYASVVDEVIAELLAAAERACAAGVSRAKILLDPGIGFDKSTAHSLAILRELPRFVAACPFATYVGASRKSVLSLHGEPPAERLGASLAVALHAQAAGVSYLRVHDVADTVRALAFAALLRGDVGASPSERGA